MQIKAVEKRASLAEREQALALIPLVRSVVREIEERSRRLLFLEAAQAALCHARHAAQRRLHEQEAHSQRRELARAERELTQLDCEIVVSNPLTVQMAAPSGARMLWILGLP